MANQASNVTAISEQAKAIDELREQVRSISAAVDAIKKTGITEQALLALLVHACPPPGKYKAKLSARTIKLVLTGMANLDAYVFGQKKKA